MQRKIIFRLGTEASRQFQAALRATNQLRQRAQWRLVDLDEGIDGGLPAGRFVVSNAADERQFVPFQFSDAESRANFAKALIDLRAQRAEGWEVSGASVAGARITLRTQKVNQSKSPRARRKLAPKASAQSERLAQKILRTAQGRRPSAYDLTEAAALQALRVGKGPDADKLRALLGDKQFEELQQLAVQVGEQRRRRRGLGDPLKVLVLPGIMGSKLGRRKSIFGVGFNDVIWLDPVDINLGRLDDLALTADGRSKPGIGAVGILYVFYLRLKLSLDGAGFDADFYPYDWRRDITELGAEMAAYLKTLKEPVAVVAHSMGGLVTRAALKQLPGGGRQHVKRLVMIGTPNHGSFVPVQALRGVYPLLQTVGAMAPVAVEQLVKTIFSGFPGLYQLLAATEKFSKFPLYTAARWPSTDPRCRPELLTAASQVQRSFAPADDRFHLIAGVDQETVVDVDVENDEFVYQLSQDGDGTVPRISAELPGCASTHYVRGGHGSLPNMQLVCRMAADLVRDGRSNEPSVAWVPTQERMRRVREGEVKVPPVAVRSIKRGEEPAPEVVRTLLAPLMALEEETAPAFPGEICDQAQVEASSIVFSRPRQRRLEIALLPGSLTDVSCRAYVLGLFRGVAPAGAAAAVDARMGGVISDLVQRRMFGGNFGEVFILPKGRSAIRADHVIFVGLGAFDRFQPARSLEADKPQAMRLVAESVIRACLHANIEEFATVLLGSSAATSTQEAVSLLTRSLVEALDTSDPQRRVRRVILCETNVQRVGEIRAEIVRLATSKPFDNTDLQFDCLPAPEIPDAIPVAPGVRRVGGSPAPIYLLARMATENEGDKASKSRPGKGAGDVHFETSILTPESKAAVLTHLSTVKKSELKQLLGLTAKPQFSLADLETLGQGLAQMVFGDELPRRIEELVDKRRQESGLDLSLVVVHDLIASSVPWETIRFGKWIPAVTGGVSRHHLDANLSVAKWLEHRQDDPTLDVLLVTNPTNDLAGAEEEGALIRQLLGALPGVNLTERRHPQATRSQLMADFSSGRFDVIHYAGHAHFDEQHPGRSGIYCSPGKSYQTVQDQVLSGADLAGLSNLPALVFFNACESGRVRNAASLLARARRGSDPTVAENIPSILKATRAGTRELSDKNISLANAFIRGGVANFLGTYWPVGDLAALTFSRVLYPNLIKGKELGAAVLEARQAVAQQNSVDWADYILYGSPDFVLKKQ